MPRCPPSRHPTSNDKGKIIRYPGTQERGFVRTLTAAVITVGLVVSLSACASPGAPAGSCTTGAASGDASSLVTATGETGTALTVDFPTPLITDGTEISTVFKGDGRTVYPGQIADLHVTAANATTGEVLDLGLEPSDLIRRTAGESSETGGPFGSLIECATVGSRIAATMTIAEAFGAGADAEGLGDDDTVVLVLDIAAGYLGKADGTTQLPVNGMPAVVLAPNGQPGIVVPGSDAPKDASNATLKQGDGATVKEGDLVVAHYTAITWTGDEPFLSTWDEGAPATLPAVSDDTATAGVVPALADALIGAKVGSQLLVVAPPGTGFGASAQLPTGVTSDDTLVYVVDVLGLQSTN
jgi:hypothetical protein